MAFFDQASVVMRFHFYKKRTNLYLENRLWKNFIIHEIYYCFFLVISLTKNLTKGSMFDSVPVSSKAFRYSNRFLT